MKTPWRCFHCDDVFTRVEDAREHFGGDQGALAACQIKGSDRDLVSIIRSQEKELESYRREDSRVLRAWRSKVSELEARIRLAEERGFDSGVQEAKKLIGKAALDIFRRSSGVAEVAD